MQLSKRQKEIIANLLFAGALFFGFYENVIWIQYLTSAFVWVMLLGYLASLLILLKDRHAREELKGKGGRLPRWVTIPFDVVVIAVFVSNGWYGTAAAYLTSSLYAIWAYGLTDSTAGKE